MNIFPGFGGGPSAPPPLPPPLPPPVARADPAVEQAKLDLKNSVAKRRGRAGSILTQNKSTGGSILNESATGEEGNLG
tara:strand:- start:640 stop:873 length:234 start_codon:yes stop_codon:yes gene_type:complete